MALDNVGIGSVILNMIQNVPTTISGAGLWNMIDQNIYFAEQFTGNTIGTSVANIYQPAIISLTVGDVLSLMESQGLGTKSVSIGDMSITKGLGEKTSISFRENGIEKLRQLGEKFSYYKALG